MMRGVAIFWSDGTSNTYYENCSVSSLCNINSLAHSGDRYTRFKAKLTAAKDLNDIITDTPSLQDLTVSIFRYEIGTYELVSSPYDAGDSTNAIKNCSGKKAIFHRLHGIFNFKSALRRTEISGPNGADQLLATIRRSILILTARKRFFQAYRIYPPTAFSNTK